MDPEHEVEEEGYHDERQLELPFDTETPEAETPKKERTPKACINYCALCQFCDNEQF